MKRCPACGDSFGPTVNFCKKDGSRLISVGEPFPAPRQEKGQVPQMDSPIIGASLGSSASNMPVIIAAVAGVLLVGLVLGWFLLKGDGVGSKTATGKPNLSQNPSVGGADSPAKPGTSSQSPDSFGGGVDSSLAPGTLKNNSIGMELVWIPPGEFVMGSPPTEIGRQTTEGPQRMVRIANGYWMGRYEVTQGQWQSVMGSNPSGFKNCGPECPVEWVSWNDAKEFIARLNAKNDGFVYSLPTEAEWEYAARAGTTTAFAFGDSLSSTQANFDANFKTTKVGSYKPNAWGLYDMHGNVSEWVEDIFKLIGGYEGLPTDGSANLTIGKPNTRISRGGGWFGTSFSVRSASRGWDNPAASNSEHGFRIVARRR